MAKFNEQKCRECGCTWNNACEGGCYWVEEDLCSRCADKIKKESTENIRITSCCMCPARGSDFKENICDDQTVFLNELVGKCNFVNTFKDNRGWIFFVRSGIGESNYKTFYKKSGSATEHGYKNLPWRDTFEKAQEDLNQLALKKGWGIVQ